jgi:hypothetical protein
MNERIRELWDKAATALAAYPSGQNNSWETQVNFMEKFAELIVRECIKMVETEAAQYAEPVWAFELVNNMYEQWEIST